jgi:hypothetical protein
MIYEMLIINVKGVCFRIEVQHFFGLNDLLRTKETAIRPQL